MTDRQPLRICTRKSPLALWQAETVRGLLEARGHGAELLALSTQGDRILDRALSEVGGKGLFVQELEEALRDGRGDLAVHSAKDVPFALAPEFSLCAFPMREDPRDALVAPKARTFAALPKGARVGTSSLRRAAQLLALRPDLRIVPIRGNVATRLSRATGVRADGTRVDPAELLDAVVLALAGLRRLDLEAHVTEVLSTEISLPAAGQGALALEAKRGSEGEAICKSLDDRTVSPAVLAERAVLARLGGGCTVPIGAFAERDANARLSLRAVLGGPDAAGKVTLLRAEASGPESSPEALGTEVAELLLAQGALELLAKLSQAQARS